MGDVMDLTVLHTLPITVFNYKGKAYGRQEKAPTRLIFDPNRLLVQTRHNFYSFQCTCKGKYCFLNLFVVVSLLFFSRVACRCIVKCESIVHK